MKTYFYTVLSLQKVKNG
ncbi:hypothetical protein Anas_07952 [Armadillidium nasatum]|uniref:Uncharacterized protein n=1 Tax=Armadillidium nasatum TaxID=96803 RepID=A0A5N5TCK3_9CRUS|nr:hypothetical protein Anas_07952 [Armadillidium nasatum]